MKCSILSATILITSLFTADLLAAPKAMITHNLTDTTTNAYVDGRAAPQPAWPNETTKVSWTIVKAGCRDHREEGICPAMIKMDIDSSSPIVVGTLYIDLETGVITPAKISANGFTVEVNAPGEITVLKD
ncbi:Uncharacterised protein [Legionella busanensis]|uniref:Uncharacterized protein n=1 Tax=Legionella busanensis TaxID=190655 RepID=A0A378JQG9_9GAMM|nr:hypothetical protein [Legionella busanensis]STX52419.1 Uncharacterised protein [Legionella busanensis]